MSNFGGDWTDWSMKNGWEFTIQMIYTLVMTNIAIEHGHWNSWFSHWKLLFSIAYISLLYVYQTVPVETWSCLVGSSMTREQRIHKLISLFYWLNISYLAYPNLGTSNKMRKPAGFRLRISLQPNQCNKQTWMTYYSTQATLQPRHPKLNRPTHRLETTSQ